MIDDSKFPNLTESQLRAKLESYRKKRGSYDVDWATWKSAETAICGELRFRRLVSGDLQDTDLSIDAPEANIGEDFTSLYR
jgi:hypothetical protein